MSEKYVRIETSKGCRWCRICTHAIYEGERHVRAQTGEGRWTTAHNICKKCVRVLNADLNNGGVLI